MANLNQFAHAEISKHLKPGDVAIDATVGNGYDTLFLAHAVGAKGLVVGFDVQAQAIDTTQKLLAEKNIECPVRLIQQGHENLSQVCKELSITQQVTAVLFNLGYLPRSDKSVITKKATTLQALESSITALKPNGMISVMLYSGHEEGQDEVDAVKQWAEQLPQSEYSINYHRSEYYREKAPEWLFIQKPTPS